MMLNRIFSVLSMPTKLLQSIYVYFVSVLDLKLVDTLSERIEIKYAILYCQVVQVRKLAWFKVNRNPAPFFFENKPHWNVDKCNASKNDIIQCFLLYQGLLICQIDSLTQIIFTGDI